MSTSRSEWQPVCRVAELEVERGATALVHGQAVAIFRTADDTVYALGNHDPFARAAVLARGIVGTAAASRSWPRPTHKHAFDLRTGRCLDDRHVSRAGVRRAGRRGRRASSATARPPSRVGADVPPIVPSRRRCAAPLAHLRRLGSGGDDERGGDRGDALAAAGEAEPVGGGRRDGDRGADGRGQRGLGLGAARAEPRAGCRSPGPRRCRSRSRPPRTRRGGLGEQGAPRRRRPTAGSAVPKLRAQVAEPRGGQQRVAGGVRGDVARRSGPRGPAARRARPARPGAAGTPSTRRWTSVPMPTRGAPGVRCHPMIMPERQSTA